MVHAENGRAIEALTAEALGAGRHGPEVPRPDAAASRGGRGDRPRHRPRRDGRRAGVHRAPLVRRGPRSGEAGPRTRRSGVAETCPQYLCLSDAEYERGGFDAAKFVVSPPLRAGGHQAALWRGLAARDLDTVGTDHCPFGFANPPHKQRGRGDFSKIPNGAPGIETRLTLLWDEGVRTGRITPERFVEVTATAPAKIFGLWPRKGAIAEGSDADIVLWDPEKRRHPFRGHPSHARGLQPLRRAHRRRVRRRRSCPAERSSLTAAPSWGRKAAGDSSGARRPAARPS